jgi:REP element-mobilizing transposase RayT
MVWRIRIEYAGAVYHLMARGNQGRDIYPDDPDRKPWLETPARVCAKTGWRLEAWVMMSNHYHLLLEKGYATKVAVKL